MFYKATIYYTPQPTPIEKALYYGRVYMVVLVTMVTPYTPPQATGLKIGQFWAKDNIKMLKAG